MGGWRVRVGQRLLVGGAAAATVIAGAMAVPAFGAEGDDAAEAARVIERYGVTDEELRDLAAFAEGRDMSLDEAIVKYGGLGAFYRAGSEARDIAEDPIVETRWVGGYGIIYVTEGLGPAAEAAIEGYEEVARIEAVDDPGRQEWTRQTDRMAAEVSTVVDLPFELHYDVLNRSLMVTLEGATEATVAGVDRDALAEQFHGLVDEVTVERVDQASRTEARGGESYSSCTGAFITQHLSISGMWGISTAEHCRVIPPTYGGAPTGTTATVNGRDVRVTVIEGGAHQAAFRWNPAGLENPVVGWHNPMLDAPACNYGFGSGYGCAEVESSGNCAWNPDDNVEYCALYRTDYRVTYPGDSGGPWFFGSTALGIHSAASQEGDYSSFSGIEEVWLANHEVATTL